MSKPEESLDRRRLHEQRQLERGFTRIFVSVPLEDVPRLKSFAAELRRDWTARQSAAATTHEDRDLGGS